MYHIHVVSAVRPRTCPKHHLRHNLRCRHGRKYAHATCLILGNVNKILDHLLAICISVASNRTDRALHVSSVGLDVCIDTLKCV